jgi:hypothetical protein
MVLTFVVGCLVDCRDVVDEYLNLKYKNCVYYDRKDDYEQYGYDSKLVVVVVVDDDDKHFGD